MATMRGIIIGIVGLMLAAFTVAYVVAGMAATTVVAR